MTRTLFAALLALVVLITGCQSKATSAAPTSSGVTVSVDGGSYAHITAPQLNSMLRNKDFMLINVHVPYDGEIASTDAFIRYDTIGDRPGLLPANKDARIVLYCRSGSMSAMAAANLVRLGYTGVMDLDGGMFAWQKAGFTLTRK